MNSHVFLIFEECNNRSMYTTTLQYLGMYVDKNMTYSNDLIPVYRDLEAPEIPLLPGESPKNADRKETALGKLLWNEEVKLYTKRVEKLKDNMSAIYAVVWGQCSEPMHAKLQSKDQLDIKDKERDCIWLQQVIKSIMYMFEGQAYIFDAMCSARKTLELYRQSDGQTLSDFYNNFKSLVEAFGHYGGSIGTDKGLIDYVEDVSDF